MSAKEVDPTSNEGKKQTDKLEFLGKQLEKLTVKANSANHFVEKVLKVQAGAQAALAAAQEGIANQNTTPAQLYAEGQAKALLAEAAAVKRKEEAERQKNLQK